MQINRDIYLNKLIRCKHNHLIKIITGIRRCGKSYLLNNLFYKHLLDCGINSDHIIYIPFDNIEYEDIREKRDAYKYIKSKIVDDEMYYILLDEVQLIYDKNDKKNKSPFYDVMNSLLHIDNCDIYATGSNSKFLTKDILTTFRGRSIEIRMFPLSFSEFYGALDLTKEKALDLYLEFGGLPLTLYYDNEKEKANYLKNLFTEIYEKDIKEKYSRITDIETEEILEILASQIGSYNNYTKITNTYKSVCKKDISDKSIKEYVTRLMDTFLISEAKKYDIKGKKYISTSNKYYFEDLGLRNAKLNFRQFEKTHLMENLIYNELKIRDYNVDVGNIKIREVKKNNDNKLDTKHLEKQLEIDFVCNQVSNRYYIQSAYNIDEAEKLLQEKRPLLNVNDSFKKIIIVYDNIIKRRDEDGILIIGIYEFLLNENSLEF